MYNYLLISLAFSRSRNPAVFLKQTLLCQLPPCSLAPQQLLNVLLGVYGSQSFQAPPLHIMSYFCTTEELLDTRQWPGLWDWDLGVVFRQIA